MFNMLWLAASNPSPVAATPQAARLASRIDLGNVHCLLGRQPMFQPLEIDDVWRSRRLYCSDFDAVKP